MCCLFYQVIDISEVQLIYNTSFFKSLATGGNVSRALVSQLSQNIGCRVYFLWSFYVFVKLNCFVKILLCMTKCGI